MAKAASGILSYFRNLIWIEELERIPEVAEEGERTTAVSTEADDLRKSKELQAYDARKAHPEGVLGEFARRPRC